MDSQTAISVLKKSYTASLEERAKQVAIETPFLGASGTLEKNVFRLFDDFYRGRHWEHIGTKQGQLSKPRNSKCIQVVEGMTTFITDQRAKVHFIPNPPSDSKLADKVAGAFDYWRSRVMFDITHTSAVRDSRKFGVGWLHLYADENAPLGQAVEAVNPDFILVAPNTTFESYYSTDGPEYLIHEYTAQVQKLKTLFPEGIDWRRFDPKWTADATSSMTDRIRNAMRDTNTVDPTVSCRVYEFWIRDDTTIQFEEEISGDLTATVSKAKYPGGRRIIVAGGQVLLDEANPYHHQRFPYIPIVAYPESDRFYGQSDIGIILADVVMADRAKQMMFDHTQKAGGGKLLVNPNFGPDAKDITNAPLQVLACSDVQRYMNVIPYATPPRFLSDIADEYDRAADDASGLHDISRGISSPGNRSASEILTIAESDKTRVRSAVRVIAKVNEYIASMWLANLRDAKAEWQVYVQATTDEGITTTLTPTDLQVQDEETFEITDEWIEFNVIVEDSSTLPTREQDKYNRAMELFGMQAIPVEQLLEDIDYAPRFKLWAKQREMAEAQAAMPEEAPMGEEGGDTFAMDPNAAVGMDQMGMPTEPMLPEGTDGMPSGISASEMAMLEEAVAAGALPPEALEAAMTGAL